MEFHTWLVDFNFFSSSLQLILHNFLKTFSYFLAHIKKWWWRWNIKGSTRWFSSFAWFPSRVQKKCRKEWKFISWWHQFFNSMKLDSWIKVEINIYWIFFIFEKLSWLFHFFLQSENIFYDECFMLCGFWYIQLLLFLFRCFDFICLYYETCMYLGVQLKVKLEEVWFNLVLELFYFHWRHESWH